MKTTKYFTIYFILILTHGLSQSVTIGQNLMPPMPFDGTEELEHMPLTKYDNSASDSLYDDFLSNIIVNSNSRDGGVVYTFTTCGQSGQFGPSQNQANAAYSGSNISGNISSSEVSLGGSLKGNVNSDVIKIKSTADVDGVLNQKNLSVEEGAKLKIKTETYK